MPTNDPPKPSVFEVAMFPFFMVGFAAVMMVGPILMSHGPEWSRWLFAAVFAVPALGIFVAIVYGCWWKWRQWRHSEAKGE